MLWSKASAEPHLGGPGSVPSVGVRLACGTAHPTERKPQALMLRAAEPPAEPTYGLPGAAKCQVMNGGRLKPPRAGMARYPVMQNGNMPSLQPEQRGCQDQTRFRYTDCDLSDMCYKKSCL